MVKKPSLILMVGLPLSGKTTTARHLAIQKNSEGCLTAIVSPKTLRQNLALETGNMPLATFIHGLMLIQVSSFFKYGYDAVIVDDMHLTPEDRCQWISKEWVRSFEIAPASIDLSISRALGNGPLIDKIIELNKKFEYPVKEEYSCAELHYFGILEGRHHDDY